MKHHNRSILTIYLFIASALTAAGPALGDDKSPKPTADITVLDHDNLEYVGERYSKVDLCKTLESQFAQNRPALVRLHGAKTLGDILMPTVLSTWFGYKLVLVDGAREKAVTVREQTDNFQAPPDCGAINIHAKINVED